MTEAADHIKLALDGVGVVGVNVLAGCGVGVSLKVGPPRVPVPPSSANLAWFKHFIQLVFPSAVVNSESTTLFGAPTLKTTVTVSSGFLVTATMLVGKRR